MLFLVHYSFNCGWVLSVSELVPKHGRCRCDLCFSLIQAKKRLQCSKPYWTFTVWFGRGLCLISLHREAHMSQAFWQIPNIFWMISLTAASLSLLGFKRALKWLTWHSDKAISPRVHQWSLPKDYPYFLGGSDFSLERPECTGFARSSRTHALDSEGFVKACTRCGKFIATVWPQMMQGTSFIRIVRSCCIRHWDSASGTKWPRFLLEHFVVNNGRWQKSQDRKALARSIHSLSFLIVMNSVSRQWTNKPTAQDVNCHSSWSHRQLTNWYD